MSFTAQIGRFSEKTKSKLQRVRRGVTIKLFGAVVQDTPVLSGRLRGNWRVSVGEPDRTVTERVDPAGTQVMGEVLQTVAPTSGDTPIFLSNSLPYAGRIEFDGHSKNKAPEGMVRRNVIRFNRLIKAEVKK